MTAPCGTAKPFLESDGYSFRLVALWSAPKPLGRHETHVEFDAGK
jgi:hypothetical protein